MLILDVIKPARANNAFKF